MLQSNNDYAHGLSRKMDVGWFRPDYGQKLILAITVAMVLTTAFTVGWWLMLIVAAIGLALYAPVVGNPKIPVYVGIALFFSKWMTRRRGGNIYRVNLKDTLLKFDSDEESLKTVKSRRTFPVELLAIPLPATMGSGQLGFFGTGDYIVGVILGDGHPKAMNSNTAQRFLWDQVTVDAIKRGLNTTTENVDMSLFYINRQADGYEAVEFAEERWHEDFIEPEEGSMEHRVVENDMEGTNQLYAEGGRSLMGIAVRMRRPKKWKGKDLTNLSREVVESAPIITVLRTIQSNLIGGVTNVRFPSLFELNELGYLLFNGVNLAPFYVDLSKDRQREAQGELGTLDDAMTLKRGPWPSSLMVGNDYLLANQTYMTTLAVTEFERSAYEPGYFDGLFYQNCSFMFSQFIQTQPRKKGMKQARRKRRLLWGFMGATRRDSPDSMHLEEQELMEEAAYGHLSLFHSRSRSILGRIHMTVMGSSRDKLELHAAQVAGSMGNLGMQSVRYLSEPCQVAPVLAGLCIIEDE